MGVLQKSQLNNIYQDMIARMEMGLLYDESGDLDAERFCENLQEAILEKMPEQDSVTMDKFSVAFGAVSERILREVYGKKGKEWW